MSKRVRSLLGAALVVAGTLAIILWMSGVFGHHIEPGIVDEPVSAIPDDAVVVDVVNEVVPVVEEVAGTVEAERRTTVSSRILAVIRSIHVSAGEEVERDQTLIRLEDEELRARAAEARRGVDAAAATRDSRAADFERARRLLVNGVISQSEFDRAEEAARVAEAELERAREVLRAAEVTLTYAEVRSPVTGKVVDRMADPGDTATPGKPLLSLYDPTALRIEIPVRESLLPAVPLGRVLKVRLQSQPDLLDGTVDEIVPQAETGSRTFLVKVGLPMREGVYTGSFGRVIIPVGERSRALVPNAAVERIGQLTFVTAVSEEQRPSRRLVTIAPIGADRPYEVLSGLRAGERVLLK